MTATNFAACLSVTLGYEGGYSNNPADPGHATDFGVTQAVYDAWRRSKGEFVQSVRAIEPAEYQAIYRMQYWDAVRGDQLYIGLDLAMFDDAVNSGPVTAIKALQRALDVSVDGQFGLETLGALGKVTDKAALIQTICNERVSFWRSLSTWRIFGRGWSARGNGIQAKALAMLRSSP